MDINEMIEEMETYLLMLAILPVPKNDITKSTIYR